MLTMACASEGARGGGADRVVCLDFTGGAAVIALADGAGGTGAVGARAAETVVARVRRECAAGVAFDAAELLAAVDRELHAGGSGGETTAVVVVVDGGVVRGASVGDSEAWLVGDEVHVLTAAQKRKPLVGSGAAVAIPFGPVSLVGVLVVASDGLFKYATRAAIVTMLRADPAPAPLIELVRMRSGGLPDDVAVATLLRSRSSRGPAGG